MPDHRFDILPQLKSRGLPAPGPTTMAALLDIVDEGVLGASNHVALALPLVAGIASEPRPSARDEALVVAAFIANTRGLGAPIVANALKWQTEGVVDLEPAEAAAVLGERSARWDVEARARRTALVSRAVETLADCPALLIYDYSSTVADIVRACRPHLDRILIPESRAIDGGRRYMAALADLGVEMVFLPDAALDWSVGQSDAVLLGAESVTIDGAVINTIGSTSAARAATARGVPVYGAADLFKVGSLPMRDIPVPSTRSYDFLLKDGERASTRAPELEMVPPDLVSGLLTEVGCILPADLAAANLSRSD